MEAIASNVEQLGLPALVVLMTFQLLRDIYKDLSKKNATQGNNYVTIDDVNRNLAQIISKNNKIYELLIRDLTATHDGVERIERKLSDKK